MAHEVDTLTYTREVPWHKLGFYSPNPMTAEEAIRNARLSWRVEKYPAFWTEDGSEFRQADGLYMLVRRDPEDSITQHDKSVLGWCTDAYQPYQNEELFRVMDQIAGQTVRWEVAGSLRNGQVVFGVINIDDLEIKPAGEDYKYYLVMCNHHTGKRSLVFYYTAVRVVCMNTLVMSEREADNFVFVTHRGEIETKVDRVANLLGFARESAEKYSAKAAKLLAKQITEERFAAFLNELCPELIDSKRRNKVDDIKEIYFGDPTLEHVRGTAYGAFQAVTAYTTHGGRANEAGRFTSGLWGARRQLVQKAEELLLAA